MGLVRVVTVAPSFVTVQVKAGAVPVADRASTSRAWAQSAGAGRVDPAGAVATRERLETPETSTEIGRPVPAAIAGETYSVRPSPTTLKTAWPMPAAARSSTPTTAEKVVYAPPRGIVTVESFDVPSPLA